ncbi:hypothetical protein [Veronia pacifica]|uniref:DUF4399 domain-containing protein n=1 Tax=Veronia pacifica TaxID=1080227 RepID=A0A1C3EPF3_9GAMM|nr:hypothetical protein [Veronia pacifica]ODA35128.1 hypothetical protein A8L45_05500 [Veronia pacifica]
MIRHTFLTVALFLFCCNAVAGKMAHHHSHAKSLDVSEAENIPEVKVIAYRDTMKGWNLHIATKHFRFSPENVNKAHKEGEGHGHLYIDGKKLTRIYSHWYYLSDLSPGKHKITVSLNANNHASLAVHGKKIVDEIEVIQ